MRLLFRPRSRAKLGQRKVRAHARQIFQFLFKNPYPGGVFLCGGAFKPLIDPGLKINDLDLWVRNQVERERLIAALTADGASVVQDLAPHGIKLEKNGCAIDISYRDVGDEGVADLAAGFDLACSAVGVEYDNGEIREVYVSDRLKRALSSKVVLLEEGYVERMRDRHSPELLRGIDRMRRFACDTGFTIDSQASDELWQVFENDYSEDEKRRSLDNYMETVIGERSCHDTEVLKRASDLVVGG